MLDYNALYERWGVPTSTLMVWKHRGRLPEPDDVRGQSPAWKESTIRRVERELGIRRTDGTTGTGSR